MIRPDGPRTETRRQSSWPSPWPPLASRCSRAPSSSCCTRTDRAPAGTPVRGVAALGPSRPTHYLGCGPGEIRGRCSFRPPSRGVWSRPGHERSARHAMEYVARHPVQAMMRRAKLAELDELIAALRDEETELT